MGMPVLLLSSFVVVIFVKGCYYRCKGGIVVDYSVAVDIVTIDKLVNATLSTLIYSEADPTNTLLVTVCYRCII